MSTVKLTDLLRHELEALCEKWQRDHDQMFENLHHVQARCTELLEENRALKKFGSLTDYQLAAAVTSSHRHLTYVEEECAKEGESAERVKMASMGLAGETGETLDLLKKHFYHGHALDLVKVEKELGDVLWYIAELSSSLGLSLRNVADTNIAKLKARYGEKFSEEKSRMRSEYRAEFPELKQEVPEERPTQESIEHEFG